MVRASKSISEVCTAVNAFAATKPQHGHVAFINSVLDHIDKNKLKIDVPTCDALFSVFPTENSFRTKSLFDVLWPQNTLQSTCAMNLLQRMEEGFVIPETSTYDILYERFGKASVPVRKCRRLTYWLRRFYSANPFAPSGPPPADVLETRRLLVQRLYAGLEDPVFLDVPDGAAAHTAAQIKRLDEFIRAGETVRVRGPHLTWHSGAQHKYMVLEVGTSSLTADHIVGVCTEPISPEAATAWLAVLRSACPALDTAHIAVQLEEHRVDPAPPGSVPDAELA